MMDPRSFHTLAAQLAAKSGASSAELRTAVSRAYYAAFHVAGVLVRTFGVAVPTGWEGHKLLAEVLQYTGDDKVRAAGAELQDLRKARWAADYDLEDPAAEHPRTVQKFVARARQCIKKLDDCQADGQRLQHIRIQIRGWAGSAAGAAKGFRLS